MIEKHNELKNWEKYYKKLYKKTKDKKYANKAGEYHLKVLELSDRFYSKKAKMKTKGFDIKKIWMKADEIFPEIKLSEPKRKFTKEEEQEAKESLDKYLKDKEDRYAKRIKNEQRRI